MKRAKKLLSLLLVLLLALGLLPGAVLADAGLNAALNAAGGSLSFTNDGTYPWTVESEDGVTYAQSGNVNVGSTDSSFTLSVNSTEGAIVSFEFRVFGEGGDVPFDFGQVLVDGEEAFKRYYAERWETYAVEVPSG